MVEPSALHCTAGGLLFPNRKIKLLWKKKSTAQWMKLGVFAFLVFTILWNTHFHIVFYLVYKNMLF